MQTYKILHKWLSLCLALCILLSLCGGVSASTRIATVVQESLADLDCTAEKPDRDVTAAMDYLYRSLMNFVPAINLTRYQLTTEEARYCAQTVYYSHPELFQLGATGTTFTYYIMGGIVFQINPKYDFSKSQYESASAMVARTTDAICSQVDPAWSDMEKALFLHDYLCANYRYDLSSSNYNMYAFLRDGKGVCNAYYLTYRYLLEQVGIVSEFASSDAMDHIWNLVQLDGQWYHVDVTWDDPTNAQHGRASHENFLRSTKAISNKKDSGTYHYGWITGPLFSEDEETGSRYDDHFLTKIDSALVPLEEEWYYIDQSYGIRSLDLEGDGTAVNVLPIKDRWYVLNIPILAGQYWSGIYSGLSAHGQELFYNTPNTVRAYAPSTGDQRTVYTLTDTGKNLYGCSIGAEGLTVQISGSPSSTGTITTMDTLHVWNEATCTEPKTCQSCGKTEGGPLGHTWLDATCAAPMTCELCGEIQGEPTSHIWLSATCTEPMTCDICGQTQGDPLDHLWDQGTVLEEATYETPGKLRFTCLRDPAHTVEVEVPQIEMPIYEPVTLYLTGHDTIDTSVPETDFILSGSGLSDLASVTVTLHMDETMFTLSKLEGLNGWNVLGHTIENGVLTISLTHTSTANGDSDLLRITLAHSKTAGNTTIALTDAALLALDTDTYFPVEVLFDDTPIVLMLQFTVFDVNQDGQVSLLDMTKTQRYYGNYNILADVDRDGLVGVNDLVMVLQYINNPAAAMLMLSANP